MTEGLDLHLGVDKAAGFVGRALETALREAIRSGRLHPGARLPGSRSLAADLGISRGTVVQAYAQLIAEGWLAGTTGSGTRVADLPGAGSVAGRGEDLSPPAARLAVDLRPGRPDLRRHWLKWYRKSELEWSSLLDRLAPSVVGMTVTKTSNPVSSNRGLTMLLLQEPPFVPEGVCLRRVCDADLSGRGHRGYRAAAGAAAGRAGALGDRLGAAACGRRLVAGAGRRCCRG